MVVPVLKPQEGATNENITTAPVILSALPFIPYNQQELQEILDEVPVSSEVNAKITAYVNAIEEQVSKVKRYQVKTNIKNFYHPMRTALLEIINIADSLHEIIKPYDASLANALKQLIVDWIKPLEKELKKRLESSENNTEALIFKTKHLYAEQSFVVRQAPLQKALREHLSNIRELILTPGKPAPRCYISYAWPSKENKTGEYWIQPFLLAFYEHLKAAGIKALIDIEDHTPSDSIYQFMQQYHEGNYIVLIGTESLLQKHESITTHPIKTELSIISDRFEQDYKQYGQSRIYPLLVSGTLKTAYPEIYDKYHTVRDGRERGYLRTLKGLIDWIYEPQVNQSKSEYEELWQAFYKSQPELPKTLDSIEKELKFGYHHQRLAYLQEDNQYQSIQAQEETKYSSAVSARVIGVLIESIGSSPKTLFDEHGMQFQRPYTNPDFIERQTLWNKMLQYFAQKGQQILALTAHGLGGMGKTELAQYYFLHPSRPYTLRAWFHAEKKEYLYQQYIELGLANGMKFPDEMPLEEKAKRVKNWLEQQKDCLLIYDNVPTAQEIETLLPKQGKHHILITSRNEVAWPQHQKLDVEVMEEHEAVSLIIKITGRHEDDSKLKELVKALGCLPLALAQAGAYMAVKALTIEDYLKRYQQYQAKLLTDENLRSPKHEPIWVTFDMNFEALEKDCPAALLVLKQASWLNHNTIPKILLKIMVNNKGNQPLDLLWDDIKDYIRRYSLMRIIPENHQASMHPLIQDIIRSQQGVTEQMRVFKEVCSAVDVLFYYYYNNKKESFEYKNLLSHAESLHKHAQFVTSLSETNELISVKPVCLELIYLCLGLFYEGLLFLRRKEKIYEQHYGKESIEIAGSLANLGTVYEALGKYKIAKGYHERALKLQEMYYGKNHVENAKILSNLGIIYNDLGKFEIAKEYYERALKLKEMYYGKDHIETASTLGNLGTVYSGLGKFEIAKEHYERALKLQEIHYGKDHIETATTLLNLGTIYNKFNKFEVAKEYYERALKLKEMYYGKGHIETANILANLGTVYNDFGKFEMAKEYFNNALKSQEIHYGENHVEIASPLIGLGTAYGKLGELEVAKKYYERALKLQETHYGRAHIELASTLVGLGTIYGQLEKFEIAQKYCEEALELQEMQYGKGHIETATTLGNLGNIYSHLRKFEIAKDYYERAMGLQEIYYGREHVEVANTLVNIGSIYSHLSEFEKAKIYYKKALKLKRDFYGEDHLEMTIILINLGSVCLMLNKLEKSEYYLQCAREIYCHHDSNKHPGWIRIQELLKVVSQKKNKLISLSLQHKQANEYKKVDLGLQYYKAHIEQPISQNVSSQMTCVGNYFLDNKIHIEDTSLIRMLKNVTNLPFNGWRDDSYKVDAVVELHTKLDQEKAESLQKDLNGLGLFFQYNSNDQTKGFILEGINLSEGNSKMGKIIRDYILSKFKSDL